MATTLEDVINDALKLTPEERFELIEQLADSVAPALHPDCKPEIARRIADMDADTTADIAAEQVFDELQRLTGSQRPGK